MRQLLESVCCEHYQTSHMQNDQVIRASEVVAGHVHKLLKTMAKHIIFYFSSTSNICNPILQLHRYVHSSNHSKMPIYTDQIVPENRGPQTSQSQPRGEDTVIH
jgi:hypothetical protein